MKEYKPSKFELALKKYTRKQRKKGHSWAKIQYKVLRMLGDVMFDIEHEEIYESPETEKQRKQARTARQSTQSEHCIHED